MRRRRRRSREGFNFWPSLADLLLAAFMITSVLWFTERLLTASRPAENPQVRRDLLAELEQLKRELAAMRADNARLLAEVTRLNDRPPILNLPEAEGFRFDSGSAELGEDFSRRLEADIIPKLNRFCLQYEAQIDTLEIIGHTDGQAVSARGGRGSNLDDKLHPGPDPVGGAGVQFGSNADLGLLRALAVAHRMRLAQGQGRLARLDVRAYSAGQLVLPDRPRGADAVLEIGDNERRRIEIRLTKLHPVPSSPSP